MLIDYLLNVDSTMCMYMYSGRALTSAGPSLGRNKDNKLKLTIVVMSAGLWK